MHAYDKLMRKYNNVLQFLSAAEFCFGKFGFYMAICRRTELIVETFFAIKCVRVFRLRNILLIGASI